MIFNMKILTVLAGVCCVVHALESGFKLQVTSHRGKQYDLDFKKTEASILHPNLKVISINENKGKLIYDVWQPTSEELQSAEDLLVDHENQAIIRVNHEDGERKVVGVVDGNILRVENGVPNLSESEARNRSDYIDIGRKLTFSPSLSVAADVDAVAELLVVCDKEFGDVYQHNRNQILDYLTVYFWDVNMRYKTLPSTNLAFRITAVVIINSPQGQPFIEEARGEDGRTEFGRILGRFGDWVYGQIGSLPKFDLAALITNAEQEWGGGLAYVGTACAADDNSRKHWGTTVFNDGGDWGSLTVGAHEIGHVLGAPHDDDENYPGGCSERGHIMGGGNDDLRWFFSTCSDRTIGALVRSNEGSCLRQINEPGLLPIGPDYDFILAPTMIDQCRQRLNNPEATIEEPDTANCKSMRCLVPMEDGGGWWIYFLPPVDNTPCLGGGRCFRGRCRQPGSKVGNVGSGQCMIASDPFTKSAAIQMLNCPGYGTPLERFVVTDTNNGKILGTPYATPGATENDDKCLYVGTGDGDTPLFTDTCDMGDNPWHGWDFIDAGNGEFVLKHRITGKCAFPKDGWVYSNTNNCNSNDANSRWRLL